MSLPLPEQESHFETYADDVASILRTLGQNFGGTEQLENDPPDDTPQRRFALTYDYPTDDQPGHVAITLWHGQPGTLSDANAGKSIQLDLPPTAYQVGYIDIVFIADNNRDEYAIDGKHTVHSNGELRDRVGVMWNSDEWGIKDNPHIEDNATLYRQFVPHERFFKQNMKPVGTLLKKLGTVWDGTEQTDNLADDTKQKRFFVGFHLPTFQTDPAGQARVTPAAVTLTLWRGKPGQIQKSHTRRQIDIQEKPQAQISVVFPLEKPVMQVHGIQGAVAKTPKQLQRVLVTLWKENAFGR